MATAPDQRITELEAENAALRRQLAETLDQQAATVEVLRTISAVSDDVAPVFDAILDNAMRLANASAGLLRSYDGEFFTVLAARGVAPEAMAPFHQRIRVSAESAIGRMASSKRLVHVHDVAVVDQNRALDPVRIRTIAAGVRTLLLVPLLRDGTLLGALTVHRTEVRPFSENEIGLIEGFAAQAVIAMENARLLGELRGRTRDLEETLQHQAATNQVLQSINSAVFDLDAVLRTVVTTAKDLCRAQYAVLYRYRDGVYRYAVGYGLKPDYERFERETPIAAGTGSVIGRVALENRAVRIDDPFADPLYTTTEALDLGGAHSMLGVPLLRDREPIGAIALSRGKIEPFSDKEVLLVTTFADQVVIAIENARLLTETRESLERQTATSDILRVIAASPDDAEGTLRKIAETTMRLFDAAGTSFRIADGEAYNSAIIVGRGAENVGASLSDPDHLVRPRTLPGTVIHENRQIHLPDLDNLDPAFADWPGPPVFRAAGMRTLVGTPLRRRDRAFGALIVYRDALRPFTADELALLQSFADQAVIAMENARLLGELHERTEEVAGWNRELEARVAAQVDELGRVEHLKRFLPPQLAELVVAQGDGSILKSHRREIVVVFCDVRGYTAFAETAEPEEVIEFLGEYHAALGPLITRFEGTLSHFLGDGLMVFFNDPVPCPDPAERAVAMALAMRDAAAGLAARWRRRGQQLGFGVGIAQGYATLGQIGFADRMDYTAIGTVCNLAARLCGEAQDGQILLARRVALAVEGCVVLDEIGALSLKGLAQPVVAFNVLAGHAPAAETAQLPGSL